MKIRLLMTIILSLSFGLYFLPTKGSRTAHVKKNTSSHSENENINEEDVICSKETSSVISAPSYSCHASSNTYESPVMPVLTGPPKFSV